MAKKKKPQYSLKAHKEKKGEEGKKRKTKTATVSPKGPVVLKVEPLPQFPAGLTRNYLHKHIFEQYIWEGKTAATAEDWKSFLGIYEPSEGDSKEEAAKKAKAAKAQAAKAAGYWGWGDRVLLNEGQNTGVNSGEYRSFRNAGCGVTTFTMVLRYLENGAGTLYDQLVAGIRDQTLSEGKALPGVKDRIKKFQPSRIKSTPVRTLRWVRLFETLDKAKSGNYKNRSTYTVKKKGRNFGKTGPEVYRLAPRKMDVGWKRKGSGKNPITGKMQSGEFWYTKAEYKTRTTAANLDWQLESNWDVPAHWYPVCVLWWSRLVSDQETVSATTWRTTPYQTKGGIWRWQDWNQRKKTWKGGSKEKYPLPEALDMAGLELYSHLDYSKKSVTYANRQHRKRIMEALDDGYPVTVMFPGHFTLIVGYRKSGNKLYWYVNDPGYRMQYFIDAKDPPDKCKFGSYFILKFKDYKSVKPKFLDKDNIVARLRTKTEK